MIKRLKKLGGIFRFRKELKSDLLRHLANEQIDNILSHNKISSLSEITIKDLLKYYSCNGKDNIIVKTDFSGGISPVNDYFFLCLIAKAAGTKKYFEFGTWVGLSAYNMAKNLGPDAEIFSLDIPFSHPEIKIFSIPPEIFGHYSKEITKVHFLKSDSKDFDITPYKKQFDFVFIDGNHSYEYVKNDTRAALELLRNDNSVIAWHDYILCGELNKNVLAGILEGIPASDHKHIFSLYQSNLAIYSKSYNFEKKMFDKWSIPEAAFDISTEISGI